MTNFTGVTNSGEQQIVGSFGQQRDDFITNDESTRNVYGSAQSTNNHRNTRSNNNSYSSDTPQISQIDRLRSYMTELVTNLMQ